MYATLFFEVWTPVGPLFHRVWQDRQLDPCVTGTGRRLEDMNVVPSLFGQDCVDYTVLLWRSLEGLSSAGWNATPGTLRHCNGRFVTHGCSEPRLSVTHEVRTATRSRRRWVASSNVVRERTTRVWRALTNFGLPFSVSFFNGAARFEGGVFLV